MNRADVERIWEQIELGPYADKAERHETIGLEIPPGEYGRATFLRLAAEHRIMAGELDRAREDLELAGTAHPGELLLDVDTHWLWLALREGAAVEVDRLLGDLLAAWRADDLNVASCSHVGGLLEEHGDLRRAHRWYTLPLRELDPDDPDIDDLCLTGRLRVRGRLGLAPDRYDLSAAELLADGLPGDDEL